MATENVFTTRKLQALLDSKLNRSVTNRLQLSQRLTALGAPISVHGVDAWFKHTDSNYSLERQSLDARTRSYPLPHGRWGDLLTVFGLQLDDLGLDDDEFRKWAFRRSRQLVAEVPQAAAVLMRCADPAVLAAVAGDEAIIRAAGFTVEDMPLPAPHTDWSAARAIGRATASLVYLSSVAELGAWANDVLAVCQSREVPMIGVTLDGAARQHLEERGVPCLDRCALGEADYPAALREALQQVAGQAREHPAEPAEATKTAVYQQRPSIAVLPFADFSAGRRYQQHALALAEDIISMLCRIPELFVVSFGTTRCYQDRLPDSRDVRDELGVRYVLEGSIREGGTDNVRVTAQLVDAVERRGLWGERFDRGFENPLDVLDELALAICAQLEPRISLSTIHEGLALSRKPAWRLWQEGWHWLFVDAPMPLPERSIELFREALAADAEYPLAHAGLSIALSTGMLWGGLPPEHLDEAKDHAAIAYRAMPENAASLYAMAMISFVDRGPLDVPLGFMQRAVAAEPSNPMYHAVYGYLLAHAGEAEAGLGRCRFAMRLSPMDSRGPFLCYMLGNALIATRDYAAAVDTMLQCVRFDEVDFVWLMIAYAHCAMGDAGQARAYLRRIDPSRGGRFYRWAVEHRLWMGHSSAEKSGFAELLAEMD